jgi:antitoxin (DNA-binding transcriptional repressor) of toxin-antitoxin stability system
VEANVKIASVKDVKDNLSRYLKNAEKGDVVITKNGRPTAVLHHLGEDELEDYLLEHDSRFRQKVERRWKEYLKSGGRSLEQVLKEFGD